MTELEEKEEFEEEDLDELEEQTFLLSLQESIFIRAMTGSSSQKLTTLRPELIFVLK
jgi:helix-turn-helix protein